MWRCISSGVYSRLKKHINRKYAGTKFQLCILHSLQVRFSCNLQSKDLQCKAAPSGCITVVHFLFPPTGLLPLQYVNHNIQLEKEKRLYLESCRHQMDRPDLPCKKYKISKRLRLGWPAPAALSGGGHRPLFLFNKKINLSYPYNHTIQISIWGEKIFGGICLRNL